MEPWLTITIALCVPLFGFLGVLVTVKATKGKMQTDYRTAAEKRMDDRMESYTSRLEKRQDEMEEDNEKLRNRVSLLETSAKESAGRERSIYLYLTALRTHILGGFPPPPPAVPDELIDWYENFEDTFPTGRGGA